MNQMVFLDLACRVAIAVIFLTAVIGKARSRQSFNAFANTIRALGINRLVMPVAFGVVLGELSAGVLVLPQHFSLIGYLMAALMLTCFIAAISRVMVTGATVRCRCFLSPGGALGKSQLVRNAILLLLALAGLVAQLWAQTEAVAPALGLLAISTGVGIALIAINWDELTFLVNGSAQRRV